jgi:hypothetical protein
MDSSRLANLRHELTASRRSLFGGALGAAAFAGVLAAPDTTRAAKAGKQAKKRCKRQQGACADAVRAFCLDDETCLTALLPCCALLARCNAGAATECFLSG